MRLFTAVTLGEALTAETERGIERLRALAPGREVGAAGGRAPDAALPGGRG